MINATFNHISDSVISTTFNHISMINATFNHISVINTTFNHISVINTTFNHISMINATFNHISVISWWRKLVDLSTPRKAPYTKNVYVQVCLIQNLYLISPFLVPILVPPHGNKMFKYQSE